MKDDINIDREILFFRYTYGIATSEEKELVEELIKQSVEFAAELQSVQHAVDIKKKIKEVESYDSSTGYKEVQRVITRKARRNKYINMLMRTASILAIPLLISTFIFGYIAFSAPDDYTVYAEITGTPGTISEFELPDKSKVWLNSSSTLRYPTRFKRMVREVTLDGEGYFEVKADEVNSFSVATSSGMKIVAHGTKFNVNTGENIIETILAEGKVTLFFKDRMLREMNPKELASFNPETNSLKIKSVSLTEKLAWKDGKIVFRNAPLQEVFEQLSRRYNVDIVLHDEHNQASQYLSRVTFKDETIQQIFSYLELAAPIKWKISRTIQNEDSTLIKQRIDVWLKKK